MLPNAVQPIHKEELIREALLQDMEEGIKVRGKLMKAMRFADDQAMVVGKEEKLQRMMGQIE